MNAHHSHESSVHIDALALGSVDPQVCKEGKHAQRPLTDLPLCLLPDVKPVGLHLALQMLTVVTAKEDEPMRVVGPAKVASCCTAPPEVR